MKLSSFSASVLPESTTKFAGTLTNILGNGNDYTINYGGTKGRPPMLYAMYPMGTVKSILKKIQSRRLVLPNGTKDGYVDWTQPDRRKHKIAHVGEAHLTIAMDLPIHKTAVLQKFGAKSLEEAFAMSGLFDTRGNGKPFPMIPGNTRYGPGVFISHAKYYQDELDPQGPLMFGLRVECDLEGVRESIGLPSIPTISGVADFKPHITIGYMNTSSNIKKQIRRPSLVT